MGLAEFKAKALALGGLVHGHDFQETSGTFADFSASALPSTIGAGGAYGGAALVTGAARSLTGSGTGVAATRAVSGGSPLQITGDLTVVEIVRITTATTDRGFVERNNNWTLRYAAGQIATAYIWLGGALQSTLPSQSLAQIPAASATVLVMRWRQPYLELFINGVRNGRAGPMTGTITATTDALSFAQGSNVINGLIQAHALFNRGLDDGEIRELTRDASTSMDRLGGVFFDHAADSLPIVAAASSTTYCAVTGGRMRANEPSRVTSAGRSRQPTMRSVERRGTPVINASSTQADYAARTMGLATHLLMSASMRPNTTQTVWHTGTEWTSSIIGGTGNRTHLGVLAAIMARYIHGGGRGARGLTSPDPLINLARLDIAWIVDSLSDLPTSGHLQSGEFALSPFGEMIAALEGLIPASEWDVYVEQYLECAEHYYSGGAWSGGSTTPEYNYYVNGNREGGEHLCYVNARTFDPSPSSVWDARVESHYTFWTAPPSNANGTPFGADRGFGLVTEVAGANPDGRDGKGWFRESHGGSEANGGVRAFWNVGGQTEIVPPTEDTDVNGRDWGYVYLCNEFVGRTWLLTREERYLRFFNFQRNKLRECVNTTTWVCDAAFGSRHCGDFYWNHPMDQILTWAGGRTDLNATEMAAQFNIMDREKRVDARGGGDAFYRDTGYELGNLLMALDDYPS